MRGLQVLMLPVVVVLLAACDRWRDTESETMTEEAKVADLLFMPANHGRTEGQFQVTGKGNLRYKPSEDFTIAEHYAIVFECQHGSFVVDHDQVATRALWQRLKRDQQVTVYYKEKYREKWTDDKLVEKNLVGFDFLDAKPAQ